MGAEVNKLIDTSKRVVYKFTSDVPETPRVLKIDAGSLLGALNTTNQLLSNDPGNNRKSKYRLALKAIWYDINPVTTGSGAGGGHVELSVDGDAGVNSVMHICGQGNMIFDLGSDTLTIDLVNGVANTTGNVFLCTNGFLGGNNSYTIIADFRKNAEDYNAGQFNDPMAFNAGPRSGGGGTGF